MNWLETLLTPALVRAVGYTILHSLWQGAVVALALAGLLLLLRRHTPQVRYNVTAAALGLVLLLAGVTFLRYYVSALAATAAGGTEAAVAMVAVDTVSSVNAAMPAATEGPLSTKTVLRYIEQHLPLLVALWFMGLLTMTLRLLGGLAYVQRLRHYGTQPLGQAWQDRLNALSERAGLKQSVMLLESSLVRVPIVVGHLRPLILLPLGAVAGLSAVQLEAILAHELAHVVRRDYLINLLQSIAETLLFYHPAVWFLSNTLRAERENCCDDVAASLCGNPLVLARALAALAELGLERVGSPRLTLAAVGPKGSLLSRVRRLVQGRDNPTFSEGFMAACVVMVGLMLLSFTAAAALTNPRLTTEAPQLLRNAVLKPFIAAPVPLAPLAAAEECPEDAAAVAVMARQDDEDEKRKRKKRKDDSKTRVVVVDRNLATNRRPSRGANGTVVIEKDKKGRLTDLYVNGQRVEGAGEGERGGKKNKKNDRLEVVQLVPDGRVWRSAADTYEYSYEGAEGQRFRSSVRRPDAETRLLTLSGMPEVNALVLSRDALASAEQALRQARSQGGLSEKERKELDTELERLREQRDELREREAERRAREAEVRARLNEERAREREAQYRERELARIEREKERLVREKERAERNERIRKVEDGIIAELVKDGLIKDKNQFQITLTARELEVNGQKQPEAVADKYRKMYEEGMGRSIGTTGKVMLNNNGSHINRIYTSSDDNGHVFINAPAPPAPPAPPAAGLRRVPDAPRPPRAPRAPRTAILNGVDVGSELRKDGLIGDNDRSFQFRINNNEMVVNGKKQPTATLSKYLKLLGGEKGNKVDMNITVTE